MSLFECRYDESLQRDNDDVFLSRQSFDGGLTFHRTIPIICHEFILNLNDSACELRGQTFIEKLTCCEPFKRQSTISIITNDFKKIHEQKYRI